MLTLRQWRVVAMLVQLPENTYDNAQATLGDGHNYHVPQDTLSRTNKGFAEDCMDDDVDDDRS